MKTLPDASSRRAAYVDIMGRGQIGSQFQRFAAPPIAEMTMSYGQYNFLSQFVEYGGDKEGKRDITFLPN